jgi:nucleotide-binding universal stress UspA family protein
MTTPTSRPLPFETIALPLASEQDAETTCAAIRPYLSPETRVVVIHLIEKAGGWIDAAPVEQRKQRANRIFERCTQELSDCVASLETTIHYHTDLADGILEAVKENEVDLLAFTPRGGSRFRKLLTGDTSFSLIHEASCPVLVVPHEAVTTPNES